MGKSKILALILLLPALASALTLSQIRDRVRLMIAETDSNVSYFSNTELLNFINDGQSYLSGYGIGVEKQSKTVFAVATGKYTLPTDYMNWIAVGVITKDSTYYLSYTEPALFGKRYEGDLTVDGFLPVEFTISGDSAIIVHPYPKVAGDTLLLEYSAEPAALGATDTCKLIFNYQLLMIYYVVAQTYLKDNAIEKWQVLMNYIDQKAIEYEKRTFNRQTVLPRGGS